MLSGRQLFAAAVLVLAIAACERSITYVDRPGPLRYDTTVVTVPRPETSFVQLPGRVDTVITVRVDSLLIIRHDTVTKHDTVTHWDTVIKRDTLRDTVVVVTPAPKPETVFVHKGPAELPRLAVDTRMPDMPMNGDTTYTGVDGKRYCFGPYVTRDEWCPQYIPGSPPLPLGTLIQVGNPTPAALRFTTSTLILPSWRATH